MRDLLSPDARRLLGLLTPEPIPLSMEQSRQPAVMELQRYGLVEVMWTGTTITARLTRNGRQQVPGCNH